MATFPYLVYLALYLCTINAFEFVFAEKED